MSKLNKFYDCIIFGGGLSGLLASRVLTKKNKSFLIIEPSEKLGGRLSGWNINEQILPSNLNLYSENENNLKYFNWLEETLEQDILSGKFVTSTYHFQDGQFKNFNGFGDRTPLALEQFNKFCFEHDKIKIKTYPQDWINNLVSNLDPESYLIHSEITKINYTDGKASSAEINGKTWVEFDHLIWAVAPQKLLSTLPPEALNAGEAKKLKKQAGVFDALILNLSHNEVSVSEDAPSSVYCLYGSNTEFEPIVGTLSTDHSCWMTFIESEKAQDHEFVTKIVKNMKKQIRRAFPTLFDSPNFSEKIILSESSYGHLSLKEMESGFLKTVPNLFCTSSLCSEAESGLIGTLNRATLLEQNL